MRLPALSYAVIAGGLAAAVAGAVQASHRPLTALTLLAAAALAAELLEEPGGSRVRDPLGSGVFRVASGVDVAAAIVLGPWRGALVAGAACMLARALRGSLRTAAFQASAFALASVAAGYAFRLGGAYTGALTLPDDLVALAALGVAYLVVARGLLDLLGGGETFQPDLAAAAAETGLGAILALFALDEPWNVLVLVPVALAVTRAHARARRSRRETLHALETFANIVDERDPSTYRHSLRVAGYVDQLARALELPYSEIDRLRRAARLLDLGKVAVDAALLRKPGKLRPLEWAAMARHPRLSARLLQRFEFSSREARAVELHHERYDGRGYYGVPGDEVPLASHFLIVADSYDAMRTDRPYRAGLSQEEALAEIVRNIGTQFHPGVAKAFVAVQRGLDPYAALSREEREELRDAAAPYQLPRVPGTRDLKERPELVALMGLVAALGGVGLELPPLAVLGALVACLGLFLEAWGRLRRTRVRAAIASALIGFEREEIFGRLAERLRQATRCNWIGLVSWEEDGLGGSLELSQGEAPSEQALMSWLVREAESQAELLLAPGHELGDSDGVFVALPLRRENSALVGFVAFHAPRVLQRYVRSALADSLDSIGLALAATPPSPAEPPQAAEAV
jgi:HD domain